jgi:hypothetical protein
MTLAPPVASPSPFNLILDTGPLVLLPRQRLPGHGAPKELYRLRLSPAIAVITHGRFQALPDGLGPTPTDRFRHLFVGGLLDLAVVLRLFPPLKAVQGCPDQSTMTPVMIKSLTGLVVMTLALPVRR